MLRILSNHGVLGLVAAAQSRLPAHASQPQPFWWTAQFFFTLAVFFALLLALWVVFRALRNRSAGGMGTEERLPRPAAAGETAFASASVQAVIRRLREQEKDLQRLHREVKDRAAETERLTEAVTRQMPTGLLLVNATGMINLSNPAAEQTLGVGALQYRRYSDVLGADTPFSRLLESCLRDGRTYQREEVEHRTSAGDVRHLGLTISPVNRDAQKVAGALCLLSDLTELTALQRTLRLKESLATLGEMSAGIAHEFKNSLATISAYAQLVQQELPLGEVAENAGKILQEARTLTHVVTEFLRFARPLEVSRGPVALGPLVERVVAEARESHPRVECRAEGDFPRVTGDEGLLRQALLNLVRNAAESVCEYRREGSPAGHVVVRGERTEGAGGRMVRVVVADDGPGIPEGELPKLFVPFYTTKPDGTGLGLAVVQKIAVNHGGGAEARNLPGGGAEFILTLPAEGPGGEAVD
jgi:PAS domain S-box-containing protein